MHAISKGQRVMSKNFVTYQSLTVTRARADSRRARTLKSVTYRLFLTQLVRRPLFFCSGWETEWESAGKPGSVVGNHSSGMRVAAHLEQPTRKHARAARRGLRRLLPYLALLPVGFALPSPLPSTRCALTAPFQPCRHACARLGGMFSVALSVGSRPPGVTWHRTLWSPDFPPRPCGRSDCLADSRAYHSASPPRPQVAPRVVSFASASARA